MAASTAKTVPEYLASLEPGHRAVISAVRRVIRRNLPKGYREVMNWGMIAYEVPLSTYPNTYNGKPLTYAALARQKHTYTVYLTSVYQDQLRLAEFKDAYMSTGKRLDMGKSCVHFRSLDQLPLDVIGQEIARVPMAEFLAQYESARAESQAARGKRGAAAARSRAGGPSTRKVARPRKRSIVRGSSRG